MDTIGTSASASSRRVWSWSGTRSARRAWCPRTRLARGMSSSQGTSQVVCPGQDASTRAHCCNPSPPSIGMAASALANATIRPCVTARALRLMSRSTASSSHALQASPHTPSVACATIPPPRRQRAACCSCHRVREMHPRVEQIQPGVVRLRGQRAARRQPANHAAR